jgi:hypothetical protein
MQIIADCAPGLIKAIRARLAFTDRQHRAVHRVRNPLAKLPARERIASSPARASVRQRQMRWGRIDRPVRLTRECRLGAPAIREPHGPR